MALPVSARHGEGFAQLHKRESCALILDLPPPPMRPVVITIMPSRRRINTGLSMIQDNALHVASLRPVEDLDMIVAVACDSPLVKPRDNAVGIIMAVACLYPRASNVMHAPQAKLFFGDR